MCSSRSSHGFDKFEPNVELPHTMLRQHPLGGIALARAHASIFECPFQILISSKADADQTEPGIRPSVQSIAYHQG
jgi:hypothetical protein